MKQRLLTVLSGVAIALVTPGAIAQSNNTGNTTYRCGTKQGIPVTLARTATRGEVPFIYWRSDDLPPPLTAQQRCNEVSRRFQAYRDNGTLRYMTGGVMRGQPVICVAQRDGGSCTGLLLTLRPGSDPQRALQRLIDLRGLDPDQLFNQSSGRPIYVNVEDYLNRVPRD